MPCINRPGGLKVRHACTGPAPLPPHSLGWTVVQSKRKAAKATKKQLSPPQPTMDQRRFEFVHHEQTKLNRNEADNIASYVNRALHRKGSSSVRVERIRCTDTGRILGVTTPTSTLQDLLEHRGVVLQAARAIDSSIRDVVPQQKWKWIRIHKISLTRYMGKARDNGLIKLREELAAENSGMHIPAEIRWLGGAKVRARFQANKDGSSSIVAAVLGEASFGASAIGGSDYLDAGTRSTPSRRHGGQMLSAADAVGGSILLPTAWQQLPGALSARRTTSQPTTDAPSRDTRWGRATHAHMGRPSA